MTEIAAFSTVTACSVCGKQRAGSGLPSGWCTVAGAVLCESCGLMSVPRYLFADYHGTQDDEDFAQTGIISVSGFGAGVPRQISAGPGNVWELHGIVAGSGGDAPFQLVYKYRE